MHSSDKDLLSLLIDDEASSELQAIAQHVEECSDCQARLQQLSGAGRWTSEVVAQLRTSSRAGDSNGLDATDALPRTIIDHQPSDSDDSEIEVDPIRLDFLGSPTHPELLGRLGRYDIERVIGAGGMGIVLKGYDSELHRAVAIKVLAPHLAHSAAARRRFAREAQATAAVIHPNVIPIHNVECEGKMPYLVMRYINGQSLQARVDEHGPLAVIDALRIAQQTAAGLAAAHAQGLIHRDVKPANILLDEGIQRVVLSDFGLARTVDDASLTHTGIVTGTPHYMSPEQAGGDTIDCRSDLFSLGCVLWFMLTGRPPFRAATAMGVLNRICHDSHHDIREINGSVPVPFAQIIDRLLAKDPDERTRSAHDVEQELLEVTRAIQAGQLAMPAVTADATKPSRQRARATTKVLASVCVIGVFWAGTKLYFDGLARTASTARLHVAQPALPGSAVPQSSPARSEPRYQSAATKVTRALPRSYVLPDLEQGDQWHEQANSLRRDVDALAEEDRQALRWLESLPSEQPHAIEQLERELDLLMRDSTLPRQAIPKP